MTVSSSGNVQLGRKLKILQIFYFFKLEILIQVLIEPTYHRFGVFAGKLLQAERKSRLNTFFLECVKLLPVLFCFSLSVCVRRRELPESPRNHELAERPPPSSRFCLRTLHFVARCDDLFGFQVCAHHSSLNGACHK